MVFVNTDYSAFVPVSSKHKIVPSNADFSAFVFASGVKPVGLTANDEFVFRSSFSLTKTETNSTPAPSPTPSTGATVSVTGFPADPTYSSGNDSTPLAVTVGYMVAALAAGYVIGRLHQFVRDARAALGRNSRGGGND